jgi:hypothetical protein
MRWYFLREDREYLFISCSLSGLTDSHLVSVDEGGRERVLVVVLVVVVVGVGVGVRRVVRY